MADMTPDAAKSSSKLCSKCNEAPAGTQVWCKDCRAKYQREYTEKKMEIIGARNFQMGVRLMREAIANQLSARPGCQIECWATAQWILDYPSPLKPPED